jgi:hypothetical protein
MPFANLSEWFGTALKASEYDVFRFLGNHEETTAWKWLVITEVFSD